MSDEQNPELPETPSSYTYTPTTGKATPEMWNKFFASVCDHGVVRRACRDAGISFDAVYYHNRYDPMFAERFAVSKAVGAEALEEEAYRRAVEGIDKGVYWQGDRVDTEVQYSDALLTLLLKGAKPEKFRERVSSENVNLNADVALSESEADQIRAQISAKLLG